eukprot:SAG25_NODE_3476_length_1068_cov_1.425181_2_plen_186_part_00
MRSTFISLVIHGFCTGKRGGGLVCVTTAVAVAALGSCCLGSLRRSRPGAPRRCPHFLASLLGAAALRVPARAAAQLCAVAGSPAWQQAACTAGSQPRPPAAGRASLAAEAGSRHTHVRQERRGDGRNLVPHRRRTHRRLDAMQLRLHTRRVPRLSAAIVATGTNITSTSTTPAATSRRRRRRRRR